MERFYCSAEVMLAVEREDNMLCYSSEVDACAAK